MYRMVMKFKWYYWPALYACKALYRARLISIEAGARFLSKFTYLERDK